MDHVVISFIRCHAWALERLSRDENGLTMLAYALGAAVIVVPLAVAITLFGVDAVNGAGATVDGAIHSVGQACSTVASDPNPFCS
ncbi:MAG: hypothetical protein O7A71_07710 [Chloroflexi bacterium]|nr:hypothetical protein [Chloroflexota bacterium]